jgi:hypothetical protein
MSDKQTWSVALFGHYKPRFYLQDKITGKTVDTLIEEPIDFDSDKYKLHIVSGWEKRCEPGDIVAFRPVDEEHKWTPKERSSFLIVTIYDVTIEQISGGLVEPYWNINSYSEYNPMSFVEFEQKVIDSEEKQNGKIKKYWKDKNIEEKNKEYDMYVDDEKQKSIYPTDYIKKKRMKISLGVLSDAGVELEQMLNRNIVYSPTKLDHFRYTDCTDKLNNSKIKLGANLRPIDPIEL